MKLNYEIVAKKVVHEKQHISSAAHFYAYCMLSIWQSLQRALRGSLSPGYLRITYVEEKSEN